MDGRKPSEVAKAMQYTRYTLPLLSHIVTHSSNPCPPSFMEAPLFRGKMLVTYNIGKFACCIEKVGVKLFTESNILGSSPFALIS